MATYSDKFMIAKISVSVRIRRHCWRVNEPNFGRTALSRTIPATHWRIATTPAGPRTGKASAAVAAPSWTEAALPVMRAIPVSRSVRPASASRFCSEIAVVVMARIMDPIGPYAKCI